MSNNTAATTSTPNAASSSKRPASTPAPTPAAKRPRSALEDDHDDEDEELKEIDPSEQNLTEAELAKKARREARTLRNRESAQRSRNQRKAHLAWLEARVVELEAENRALRSGSAPSTPCKTRESSPAHSVLSLASDLGIPSEIVTAGCGVSLATVLPPPADALTDMKPNVETAAPATPTPAPPQDLMAASPMAMGAPCNPAELYAQNEQLRWRVNMLENIVRQAANIFSTTCPPGQANPAAPFLPPAFAPQTQSRSGMEATLSPPLYPSDVHQVASPLRLQTQLDAPHPNHHHNQAAASGDAGQSFVDLSTPLARHPAAVATMSVVSSQRRGLALQRARDSLTINLDSPATQQRLSAVARLIGNHAVATQAGGSAQGNWFEVTEAAVFDDSEMRGLDDLLAELEAKQPEPADPTPSALNESALGANEWAWATKAVVDLQ